MDIKKTKAEEEVILLFIVLVIIAACLFIVFHPIFKSSLINPLTDAVFIALMLFVAFWIARIITSVIKTLKEK